MFKWGELGYEVFCEWAFGCYERLICITGALQNATSWKWIRWTNKSLFQWVCIVCVAVLQRFLFASCHLHHSFDNVESLHASFSTCIKTKWDHYGWKANHRRWYMYVQFHNSPYYYGEAVLWNVHSSACYTPFLLKTGTASDLPHPLASHPPFVSLSLSC